MTDLTAMIRIAWNEQYAHRLPPGHRFPMEKYELIPAQLQHEGTFGPAHFFSPTPLTADEVLQGHDAGYWAKLQALALTRQEERRTGFPLSAALVEREVAINGGTLQCARYALAGDGVALNVAGGTHHAFADRGEGFCLLNDLALTAKILLAEGRVRQVLIVDLDVHQGNGTAAMCASDPGVFTFSMHGASNYPMHKETSDLDVPLPDGCDDATYLAALDNHLPRLIDDLAPDLVLYQCGVDVLATDKLGRLGLTRAGCLRRDEEVLGRCHRAGIPVVCAMGGGYSPEIRHIIEAHCGTFRTAAGLWG